MILVATPVFILLSCLWSQMCLGGLADADGVLKLELADTDEQCAHGSVCLL